MNVHVLVNLKRRQCVLSLLKLNLNELKRKKGAWLSIPIFYGNSTSAVEVRASFMAVCVAGHIRVPCVSV